MPLFSNPELVLAALRELWLGPRRFSDLRASTSPASARAGAYALDEAGTALRPALRELTRWAVRVLAESRVRVVAGEPAFLNPLPALFLAEPESQPT